MKKRLLALLLALVLVLGVLPTGALAEETGSAPDVPAAAPHQYLESVTLLRGKGKTTCYEISASGVCKEFEFDPRQTEYHILIEDANIGNAVTKTQCFPTFAATLNAPAAGETLYGVLSLDKAMPEPKTLSMISASMKYQTAYGEYTKGKFEAIAAKFANIQNGENSFASVKTASTEPFTVYFTTGKLVENDGVVTFTDTDVYTFNFYSKAALKDRPVVANQDGTAVPVTEKFNVTSTAYTVDNVKKGTQTLVVTAPAYTQEDTVVKYDPDGTGTYVAGTGADTFTVDLTKYTPQADGSVVVPFMLDYTGSGRGVDGYYTLTVKFVETRPTITAETTATVNADDLGTWTPVYTAADGNGTDAAASVKVTYYQADGTTEFTRFPEVLGYIGNAQTNDKFFVKLSLDGADDVTVAVTVTPVEVTPGDFIKDIRLSNYFTGFKKDQHEYTDILVPVSVDSGDENKHFGCSMYIELEEGVDPATLEYKLVILDAQGQPFHRTNLRYYDYDLNVANRNNTINLDTGKTIPIDDYTFCFYLRQKNRPSTEQAYRFTISMCPAGLRYVGSWGSQAPNLFITAGGNEDLRPVRAESQAGILDNLVTEYCITVPGITDITLKGALAHYTSKIFYQDRDITAGFAKSAADPTQMGDGVDVDLTKCEKNIDGAYIVPLTVVCNTEEKEYRREYKLFVTVAEAAGWEIAEQPQSGTYDKGADVTLSVKVEGENAPDAAYQWQYHHGWGGTGPYVTYSDIEGATGPTFKPQTEVGGVMSYRCIVTGKNSAANQTSEVARITINTGKPLDPEFVIQPGTYAEIDYPKDLVTPYKKVYKEGETVKTLQASAGSFETSFVFSPVTVEYKWYHNDKNSYDGATLLDSANYAKGNNGNAGREYGKYGIYVGGDIGQYNFTEKLSAGKHYYFCEVTLVEKDNETNRSNTIRSEIVEITIEPRGEMAGFTGKGTESEPYLIENLDHLKKIDEHVLSGDFLTGAFFKVTNDITLPVDWKPIGDKGKGGSSGSGTLPFSGIIDGDGHLLTVAKGGRPLLEYTRDAVVKNLNIYGEEINGAALLEKIVVDYGTDGVYQEKTDPDTITIENVTLKSGSKTKLSGFVGSGISSGINNVFVRNCTIEEGVTIGYTKDQSGIGSFVGPLNGRVENSVSYATVYGVDDVGGIAGAKNQTMGDCTIINCSFFGTIEASGRRVGGILGRGYIDKSAPNTPPVTIRNCCVVADITGDSTPKIDDDGYDRGGGIGGIFGSEIGLRGAWNEAYISDNSFYGTITDTNPDAETRYDRVGGIIGELGSHARDNLHYENNYYLANSNYQGLGFFLYDNGWNSSAAFVAKSDAEFKNGAVTKLLNNGAFRNWEQYISEDGTVSYPVHSDKPVAYGLTISGDFKNTYYIGEALDLSDAVFTVKWTGGKADETLNWKSDGLTITGYDSSKRAVQTLTASYGAAKVEFTVTVLQRPTGDGTFTVTLTLLGDTPHGDPTASTGTHTLKSNNLEPWISNESYTLEVNDTVWDLLQKAEKNHSGLEFSNPSGNYVDMITWNGVTLGEFSNGNLSGWMYTLNGEHSKLGVAEQFLDNGDRIVFHYTDDYTVERGSEEWNVPGGGVGGTASSTVQAEVTIEKDASGEAVAKIELPQGAAVAVATIPTAELGSGNVLVRVNADGSETVIKKSLVDGANAYALVDGDCTVKLADKSKTFDDTVSHWARDAVAFAARHELFQGVSANSFAPDTSMSRAMLATVLYRLEDAKASGVNPFADVAAGTWYTDAVTWANGAGIVQGTGKGFMPDRDVTRQELVVMLYRYAKRVGMDVSRTDALSAYTDSGEVSDWAKDAMGWAVANGLVSGRSATTLAPTGTATRAEVAAILQRLIALMVK